MLSGVGGGVGGHLGGPEGMLFTQRMAFPVVRHQNPAQAGVPAETDAVHIKDLPLVPVGRRIDCGDAGQLGVVAVRLHLEAQVPRLVEVEQVVVDGEIAVPMALPAAGVVNGGDILQTAERRARTVFEVPQHRGQQPGRHPVGQHVGGVVVADHPLLGKLLQFGAQPEVGVGVPWGRWPPDLIGAGHAEVGMLERGAAQRGPFQAGAAGVAALAAAVHQYRGDRALGTACQVQHRPGRTLLASDLLLQQHQPLQKGLGPWRATGHVDIHRNDLIDPLHHAVDVVHPAGVGAAAHGHHPARLGHLLVEPQHRGGHLLEDRTGDHHQVGFARGAAQDLGPEAGDVVAGGKGGHHLDKTAGKAEEHRPERVGAAPVDQVVQPGQQDVVRKLRSGHRIAAPLTVPS